MVTVRELTDGDRPWVRRLIDDTWGLPVITPADVYDRPEELDGVVAEVDGEPFGAVTYRPSGSDWEVVTLQSVRSGLGAGRAMLEEVRRRALAANAGRVWLITTDDNDTAIGFYTHLGMSRAREYPGFIDTVRTVKPAVPPDTFDAAIEFEWRL